MYHPNEAREDTVLFPALHTVMNAKKLEDFGKQFENEQDRLLGDECFKKTVHQVACHLRNWTSTMLARGDGRNSCIRHAWYWRG